MFPTDVSLAIDTFVGVKLCLCVNGFCRFQRKAVPSSSDVTSSKGSQTTMKCDVLEYLNAKMLAYTYLLKSPNVANFEEI